MAWRLSPTSSYSTRRSPCSDPPLPKHVQHLLPGRNEPLAFGVARLRRRAAEGQLRVEVAADGPRQVPPVVHAPIRRHVHDPQVLVAKVLVDPGRRHERTGIPARVRAGRRRAHQGSRLRDGGRHRGWMVRHRRAAPRRTPVPPEATREMLPLMRNDRGRPSRASAGARSSNSMISSVPRIGSGSSSWRADDGDDHRTARGAGRCRTERRSTAERRARPAVSRSSLQLPAAPPAGSDRRSARSACARIATERRARAMIASARRVGQRARSHRAARFGIAVTDRDRPSQRLNRSFAR